MKNCLLDRFDITEMINDWIYPSQHYPVLKMTKNDSKSVMISVENYNSWKEKIPWIPVTQVALQLDFEIYRNSNIIWLKSTGNHTKPHADLILDFKFHWIIINVEQAGNTFYKIYYIYYIYIYIYFSKCFLFI